MTTATKRVLPADVYDAIELVALVHGGIGAGKYGVDGGAWSVREGVEAPLCVWGAQRFLEGEIDNGVADALNAVGINEGDNDRAVHAINRRRDTNPRSKRVSFKAWCRELGVERGT